MVVTGDQPDEREMRIHEKLTSPDVLAVSTLGQLAKHPRISALAQIHHRMVSPHPEGWGLLGQRVEKPMR
ncbi:MAG: hypothetical protein LUQ59_08290 [Methanothrix sp.]|nr:hypothetical protein [Methanothrix sp.]